MGSIRKTGIACVLLNAGRDYINFGVKSSDQSHYTTIRKSLIKLEKMPSASFLIGFLGNSNIPRPDGASLRAYIAIGLRKYRFGPLLQFTININIDFLIIEAQQVLDLGHFGKRLGIIPYQVFTQFAAYLERII